MKTNREYERRFPWFSASLGVIAIASVATLFVTGALNNGQGEFGLFLTRTMDRLTQAQAFGDDGAHHVSFADVGRADGLTVSGYPSYASAKLPLVRDQQARAVRLVLSGRQDVSDEAVTALRVTVNGRRVMERVLSPGQRDFKWVFDLTDQLEGAVEAQVAIQLSGDVSAEVCHSDRSMGAVLSLSPDAGLEIELEGPLDSVRDVLALTPRHVTIAMDEGDDWFELASRLGARLARKQYTLEMVSLERARELVEEGREGVILTGSPDNLRRAGFMSVEEQASAGVSLWRRVGTTMVAITDPERVEAARFLTSELAAVARGGSVDPVLFQASDGPALLTLEGLGVDTSLQQVADRREWNMSYFMSQAPRGRVADALTLDFRLPDGPVGVTNVAHVALNGEFIDSRRLAASGPDQYRVELPVSDQALVNDLVVSLQRHRDDGGCEIAQQRYPVQLRGDSALMFDGGERGTGFTALPAAFAGGVDIRLPDLMTEEQRYVAARVTAETLSLFAPTNARLNYVFATSDNGRSAEIVRPFIAVNTIPANAQTPLRVYADRLVMEAGAGADADVRALSDLTLLQVSRARVDADEDDTPPVFMEGLVVHAIDNAPSMLGAHLGSDELAIVHADGAAISPPTGSVSALPVFD